MDGKEYLNQIASTVRPEKKSRAGFMSSPIFKVAIGGILAFSIIAIVGAVLTGGKANLKDQCVGLKLQLDNALSVISSYQSDLKSSDLRSSSASLRGVLSNTNRDLTEYITQKYEYKAGKEKTDLVEEAKSHKDEMESDLFNAKINGTLDRIYALKMAYEISLVMTKETTIYNATSDSTLKEILNTSYDSLNTLYSGFNDFSEAK